MNDWTHPDILRAERTGYAAPGDAEASSPRRQRLLACIEENRDHLSRLLREQEEVEEVVRSALFLTYDLKDAVLERYQTEAQRLRDRIKEEELVYKEMA